MIRAMHLRKSYGDVVAVDGVSFEIQRGETFGLLGPNGAGKTTTIHLLVGVLSPDAGEVSLDGATDPTRPSVRRIVGMAPQSLSLYEELTGHENLSFFARLHGVHRAAVKQRIQQALEFAGLTEFAKRRVKTYSGGMKRRLNLACALLSEPKILFLDEPTVGVDPQSRNHIFENIDALKEKGCTILYTTHYMEEAERLCDRVAIMDHGRILALDTVEQLIKSHGGKSVVTAELEGPVPDPATVPGTLDGTSLRVETPDPLQEVGRLAASGLVFRSLHIDQPNLERVFLTLTGRSLRD